MSVKTICNITFLLGICFVTMPSCSEEKAKVKEEKPVLGQVSLTQQQVKSVGIIEKVPEWMPMGLTIYANGTIEVPPQNKTIISVQFGGFIKSIKVMDGVHVKKGQTLMTIQHPDLIQIQQEYLEVIGNLEYLQAEVDRQKQLLDKEAGSAKSFQQAKSQLAVAQAQKNGLRAKLTLAGISLGPLSKGNIQHTVSVVAPCNGVISKMTAELGAYAEPTDHLFEIIDVNNAHAEVTVFEKDVPFIKVGQHVKLTLTNYNQTVDAEVLLVNKAINNDRTIRVHCELKQKKDVLPGAYFKAAIYTGESNQQCVPSEAIVDWKGKAIVFSSKPNNKGGRTFFPEEVKVIASENGYSAIAYTHRGRSMEHPVVVKGAYEVLSAMLMNEAGDE
jgi:cobalt-zinc-cadmium efflux system membrane fusion protein